MYTLDDFLSRYEARDWAGLNEITTRLLGNGPKRSSGPIPANWEDDVQNFGLSLAERGIDGAKRFWSLALKQCKTFDALWKYLEKSMRREGARDWQRPAERLVLRRQTAELLRRDCRKQFRREVGRRIEGGKTIPIYGLQTWLEGPDQRGIFDSDQDWRVPPLRSQLSGLSPFPMQPVSTRKRPYRDEDVEEGCIRLLDACSAYAESAHLARGLIAYGWCICYQIDQPLPDGPDISKDHDPVAYATSKGFDVAIPKEKDHDPATLAAKRECQRAVLAELHELVGELPERQRQVLLDRILPNCIGKNGKTLQELATLWGVSVPTVSNEEKRTLAKFREIFGPRYSDDTDLGVVLFNGLSELVENDQLRCLEDSRETTQEPLL